MLIKRRTVSTTLSVLPNCSPLLQRIYAARGITDNQALDMRFQALLSYELLTDIDKACVRLERAFRQDERIIVIGDFDADGATASALAVSALKSMGALSIDFLVPNRFDFGYGLTPGIVQLAAERKPNLIITVDNGITSFEGVKTANLLGIDVLVTDHHLPADSLPEAFAIVNPNRMGDAFSSKSIAGVGVVFYLMLALRSHLKGAGWFSDKNLNVPNMAQFLDLVALGTVADVVPLDQNNRILIKQGLNRIRQGSCRPGILALIEVAGKDYRRIRESDLGFSIGPRLNAAGRLEDMSLGIACLLTGQYVQAKQLACRLDELNQERRVIEKEMRDQATETIQTWLDKIEGQKDLPLALCLADPSWHQGVIGILAGRLKEKYHRPVIAFAMVSPDELKGSARSIPKLNIRDILAGIDRANPELIEKFGGHAMAAGLSIKPEKFLAFKTAFIQEVQQHIGLESCQGEIWTDGPLNPDEMTLEVAFMLEEAGPWGQQFPEPFFNNIFEVLDQRLVGQCHLKLTLANESGGIVEAIAFNVDLSLWPNHRARYVELVYKLNSNSYGGHTKVQLMVEYIQKAHIEDDFFMKNKISYHQRIPELS